MGEGPAESEGGMSAQVGADRTPFLRAADVHARLGNAWPDILAQLGVPEEYRREKVRNREKHGPCPGCGGTDRYFFDNKYGRGDFYCRGCGNGDGFKLLQLVHGWPFLETLKRVIEAAGLSDASSPRSPVPTPMPMHILDVGGAAVPPDRVLRLRRDRCAIENCEDAITYLASRGLWPLPPGCALKAHATVEYWHESRRVGRYRAIVADVVDGAGELVTCHVNYLQGGKKLEGYEPRKILSPMTGREGCAVRLMPPTDVLGIAEGIETALAVALLDDVPVWSALNTSLLARFEPPPGVTTLRVYGDRDEAGLLAALKLLERLQGRVRVEIRTPGAPAKDWNDVLMSRNGRPGGKGSTDE
jgi:putative DNA primase/helicase